MRYMLAVTLVFANIGGWAIIAQTRNGTGLPASPGQPMPERIPGQIIQLPDAVRIRPTRPSAPMVNPELIASLRDRLKKQEEFQRTADFQLIASGVEHEMSRQADLCVRDRAACFERDRLRTIVTILKQADQRAPACGPAAEAYSKNYENDDPTEVVAANFDLNCLSAPVDRSFAGTNVDAAPLPNVFAGGGTVSAEQGALSAVGIMEQDGIPFCAGLLRNDKTFVTARHCAEDYMRAPGSVRVTVRSASGSRGPWPLGKILSQGEAGDTVRSDWAVIALNATTPIGAAATKLTRGSPFSEVTMLGFFRHFRATSAGGNSAQAGLRYPRAGMCQLIELQGECLRLACQTIRGFSGTPIFRPEDGAAGSPIAVLGFISQADQSSAQCAGLRLKGFTLAVSADAVG